MGKLAWYPCPSLPTLAIASVLGTATMFASLPAPARADVEPLTSSPAQASPVGLWPHLRSSLFGVRPISEDADAVIRLETPKRAEDAATVPIAIRTTLLQTPQRYIRKVYLLVDNNPSPVAAVFAFTPDSGRADIETRIRIEQYTDVRAVAELSDGSLFMSSRFVKAAGGCSAPAGKDAEAADRNVGRIKFRVEDPIALGQPAVAQLAISHPNRSGLVLDQVTRLYAPAYFVRRVAVSYAGKPVLTADMDFSISENPNFRFYFLPTANGALQAEVIDTKDLTFKSEVMVNGSGSSGSP